MSETTTHFVPEADKGEVYVPKQRKLMVLIGPGGSGKTTFARDYIKKNPDWVRVSRDQIRDVMFGGLPFGEYFKSNNQEVEKHVTNLQMDQIRYWLSQGYSVIIDNTHLKLSYLKTYQETFSHLAEIIFVPFTKATPEECKERIKNREGDVNVSYIDKHFQNFNALLENAPAGLLDRYLDRKNPLKAEYLTLNQDAKGECIIVDLDGTIADCRGIRNMTDLDNLHKDRVIEPIRRLLVQMKVVKKEGGFFSRSQYVGELPKIIYVSSEREQKYEDETVSWIINNGLPFDGEIYMRPNGDTRTDHIVKAEILTNEIAPYYKILFAIDDRLQACYNVWYKAGVYCLNVNQGLKHY